jgi:hypothetical protein
MLFRVERAMHPDRMISESRIQIQYDVDKPVDLSDLTLAFGAINRQYRKFVRGFIEEKNIEIPDEDSIRLYITKIESNCIIAELGWVDKDSLFAGALVLMDNYNTMHEFVKKLMEWVAFLRKKRGEQPKQVTKRDCEDYRDILIPAVNGGGVLVFKQLKYGPKSKPKVLTEVKYASNEAVQALKGAQQRIEEFEKTGTADHVKVLMSLESAEKKISTPDAKRTHDYGTRY